MNTPTYQPHDPKAPYNEGQTYYHTTGESWFADVEYPNPAKPVKVANIAKMQRRQKRQPKKFIRRGKMRKAERELVFWLIVILIIYKLTA